MRCFLLAATLSFILTGDVLAQGNKVPTRPPLPAAADTNDATAYYDLGLELLQRSPEKAADAFYWSAQINPASPEAFYARRVALLMAKPQFLVDYWVGARSISRNKDVQRADSLYLHALKLSPFFSRKLDGVFFDAIIREFAAEAAGPGGNSSALAHEIERYLLTAPADLRAWRAYGNGRFEQALELYATAIKSARRKAPLRLERGRLLFQLDRADSALTEITLAAQDMKKSDKKDLVFVYESKALVEHSLGLIHKRLGQTDAAREAFARALQEDLSFGPAHTQLGFIALEAHDTATAISEFDLAVQIAGEDAMLRYLYGYTLQELGKSADAEVQLRKAIELNSVFAAPHLALGKALATQGRADQAAASLRAFLSLASRNDPRRAEAAQQLSALGGGDH